MNSYDIYKRSIMKQENAAGTIKCSGNSNKIYYEYDRSGEFESDISQIGRILFFSRKLFLSNFELDYSNVSCLIFYIINGSVQLTLGAKDISATQGDLIINNNKTCKIVQQSDTPLDVVILWCDGSLPLSYGRLIEQNVIRIERQEDMLVLFDKMAHCCSDRSVLGEACSLSMLSQLFCHILYEKEHLLLHGDKKEIPEEIMRTVVIMDGEYDSDICMEDLAHISGLSKSQYYRVFRKSMGMTPYEYLLNKRICAAKTLLVSTNYQIKLIASLVGYVSASHFIEHFKKKTSLTPKAYRQQQRFLCPQKTKTP